MRVAAQSLNVAQSGLRRGLKAMEKRLGFKLVQFVRGKVQPTPEAVVLFGETQELARSFGRMHAKVGQIRNQYQAAKSAPDFSNNDARSMQALSVRAARERESVFSNQHRLLGEDARHRALP
jgi:molybdenum-dependent DNA-binding transcriptional regulator ModE